MIHTIHSSALTTVASGHADIPLADLTPREVHILALIADGLTNRGIGRRLWLSTRTVESHTRSILMKLDLGGDELLNARVLAARTFWESRNDAQIAPAPVSRTVHLAGLTACPLDCVGETVRYAR